MKFEEALELIKKYYKVLKVEEKDDKYLIYTCDTVFEIDKDYLKKIDKNVFENEIKDLVQNDYYGYF